MTWSAPDAAGRVAGLAGEAAGSAAAAALAMATGGARIASLAARAGRRSATRIAAAKAAAQPSREVAALAGHRRLGVTCLGSLTLVMVMPFHSHTGSRVRTLNPWLTGLLPGDRPPRR